MPDYRRAWCPGGTDFFTVNALQRRGNDLLVRHIEVLRDVVRQVRKAHPFRIHGWAVLPDHLHCVIELPPEETDFAVRWRLIKAHFSKRLPAVERRSAVRLARGERGLWQRRYWEHRIRDDADFGAYGLCAFQPGETWPCGSGGRLAVFHIPPPGGQWGVCLGLGREE